jgi:hypothetical protein
MKVEESTLRVSWPGDLERNKELFEGVETANRVLAEELGRSKGFVSAEWKLIQDSRNRPLLELSLTDLFTRSQVIEKFADDEFRSEAHLGGRFHRMWGHLLQARSDGQIKRLEALAEPEEGV